MIIILPSLVDTEMPVPGSILRPTASKTTFALETRRDVDLDDERYCTRDRKSRGRVHFGENKARTCVNFLAAAVVQPYHAIPHHQI